MTGSELTSIAPALLFLPVDIRRMSSEAPPAESPELSGEF
jgi:hypothetical protein